MEESEHPMRVVYRIDPEQRIVCTNQAWTDFALHNGAQHLLPPKVLGSSLWDFISDAETVHLYREIVGKVVQEGSIIAFPFRCDSPRARRYMKMKAAPLPEGSCEFTVTLLKEESREPVALLRDSTPRVKEHLSVCSWCKKIGLSEQQWVEVEEAVRALHLFELTKLPRISHGMCPACVVEIESTLRT